MKKISTIIISVLIAFHSQAQKQKKASAAWLIQPSFAWHMPAADMDQYFGNNVTVGVGGAFKTQSNWRFGIDGQYIFSDNIKNPQLILAPLLTDRGFILNSIGNYASVSLLERGFFFNGEIGKNLEFAKVNANSGPDITLGAGYLMHWIEIKNAGNDTPQLLDEYLKGYDRLSGGFMLKQSLGYTYLSASRRINFRISFEVIAAFTENLRGFDYSTGRELSGARQDILYGFRFQWILPIYTTSNSTDTFFYD